MRTTDRPSKLFVAGLGDNRKSDLERVFREYGDVLSVYIDDKKQFAFVEFSTPAQAQLALEAVHQTKVNGSRLRVEYARSEKSSRDYRRSPSRERSTFPNPYHHHWPVPSSRLSNSMGHYRQGSSYQHSTHPSLLLNSSSMASRGRSLTPPSLKQSSHLSSMHHLRSEEFYPPYPAHLYLDPSAYYRPYDDPYMASRLPAFFPSMMPSSSSRAYGDLYPSASIDRHRRSRSRSRRRTTTTTSSTHRSRSSREERSKRRVSSSASPRERSPRTPSGSNRTRRRSPSASSNADVTPEQRDSSPSSSIDNDEKASNGRSFQDKNSNQKHSKRRRGE